MKDTDITYEFVWYIAGAELVDECTDLSLLPAGIAVCIILVGRKINWNERKIYNSY